MKLKNYLLKIIHAIKKYLIKDTKYFFLFSFRYFQNNYKHDCKFYKEEEFKKLIKDGKSIIRIGDGEIALLHYLKINYQDCSDEIRSDFLKIIMNYNKDSKYLLLIPTFVNKTNRELKKINGFKYWMPLKITYELIFNKHVKYFDAHIFYRDNKFIELILPYIKKKKIILITNQNNINEVKKTIFGNNIYSFIIAPEKNAYDHRKTLTDKIKGIIKKDGDIKSEFVILMSAGLSKTIIYDLSREGYQLFDIGVGLEGFYKNKSLEQLI